MIQFDNPWMLLGLLAAALPVWLHLFGRRHAPVVQFSALDFILASNPKRARALRVREWLLIALRSAVLALLAVALARPLLPVFGGDVGPEVGTGTQAVVLVIDDSQSMLARDRGETLLDRSVARAAALLERLPPGCQVGLVATGFPARPLLRQLTRDRGAALDVLRRLPARPRRDDAGKALNLAQILLDSSDLPLRRLVVLSDLQATGWSDVSLPTRSIQGVPIQATIDRLESSSRENTAVVDAVVTGAADRANNQVRLEVAVTHFGEKPFRNYLNVQSGDREVKSLLQLQPGETVRRSFSLPAGAQWAEVSLPPDALEADNRRMVRLDASTALRVALVNGAPRPVPRDDEVFFAARALELGQSQTGQWLVDVLPADKLGAASLAETDVVVLANVAQPSDEALAALKSAVQSGAGLLVAVGDNLPDPPQGYLQGLLPATLVGQRHLMSVDGSARQATSLRWESAAGALQGPAMQLLGQSAGELSEALSGVAVQHYALVRPDAALAGSVVARYGDGAPALLLGSLGRGQVALLTTTLDRDWTNLPVQPAFLPLLHDLVLTLARTRASERRGPVEVGEVAQLARDGRADQLEIRYEGQGSGPRRVLPAALESGPTWTVAGLDEPGRYVATELRGGVALTSRPLLVVPPSTESDLRPAAKGEMVRAGQNPQAAHAGVVTAPGWAGVLVLLLGLLVVEAVLLARGSRGAAPVL